MAELTLGPVLYNWEPDRWRDFHARIADEADVDTVYLGEVVCSKRAPFTQPLLPAAIERLQRGGKRVILSTLALVMSKREAAMVAEVAGMDGVTVEANDLSAIRALAGRPHVAGPFINVYNEGTLAWLVRNGAERLVAGAELSAATIAALAAAGTGAVIEVQVFGRLPLALSARCYAARAEGLTKDSCRFVCDRHPDGMAVETLTGQPFLAVNGTQTMSATVVDLSRDAAALAAQGVGAFRLWPQTCDMVAVAATWRACLTGRIDAAEARAWLGEELPWATFANGFVHGQAGHRLAG